MEAVLLNMMEKLWVSERYVAALHVKPNVHDYDQLLITLREALTAAENAAPIIDAIAAAVPETECFVIPSLTNAAPGTFPSPAPAAIGATPQCVPSEPAREKDPDAEEGDDWVVHRLSEWRNDDDQEMSEAPMFSFNLHEARGVIATQAPEHEVIDLTNDD